MNMPEAFPSMDIQESKVGFFRGWWKFAIGVVGGVVGLGVLGLIFAPAPSAFGALKGRSVEIYRNAEFRVYFDQPMNQRSVENAFALRPAVSGTFQWTGNRISFRPLTVLEKGTTYELTIVDSAKSLFGKKLQEPFRQTFSVLDYPEVSAVVPSDGTEIRTDQRLTVLFDHPVRTLKASPDHPQQLVVFDPPVKGSYDWLGTTGFEFVPDGGWPQATDITATIPKGTAMADGGSLVEDFVWKFHTPNLAVDLRSPPVGLSPQEAVRIGFNYIVSPNEASTAISIKDAVSGQNYAVEDFTFTQDSKDAKVLLIHKKNRWELGKTYQFLFPLGFTAHLGARGLSTEWSATVVLDQKGFSLAASCPDQGTKKEVMAGALFQFNNPVDASTTASFIHVSPELPDFSVQFNQWSSDERCLDKNWRGLSLGIYGKWKPSTRYTITFAKGLHDIYGQALEQDKVVQVETDAYQPWAELASYANQGVLASYLPRLYQVRSMNLTKPIQTELCSESIEEYLTTDSPAFSCAIRGAKTYDPTTQLNTYKITDIDLDQLVGQKLPNGFYRLNVALQGLRYGDRQETRLLVIADTALTLKRDVSGKLLVWAVDMKSGEPVSDLKVEAYHAPNGRNFRSIVTGKTDTDGIAVLDVSRIDKMDQGTMAVRAYGNEHLGFVSTEWNDGINVWNYGLNQSYSARAEGEHIGYLYTDRLIYRPDQKVYFKGVVRQDMDAALTVPAMQDVQLVIEDANARTVGTQKLSLSAFGTFHGEFQLDPSMPLGTYQFSINPSGPKGIGTDRIAGTFEVREYRRPDFKVTANVGVGPFIGGQTLSIPIEASYYYGAPLAKGQVSYQVTRRTLYFQPMQGEWYNYAVDQDESGCYWYCAVETSPEVVTNGSGELDAEGKYTLSIPSSLTDYKTSATYFVTVTVTDLNGRSVSTNLEVPVHKAGFYVGIRPDYASGWDSSNAEFDVISVNADGSVKSSVSSIVKLYRRTWTGMQKKADDGSTFWEYQKNDTFMRQQSVTTDAQGKAHINFGAITTDGEYVAVIETKDSAGRVVAAQASRYVYRTGGADSFRVTDDHQLRVIQNKADYQVGETASLAVQTPYEHSKALVTIERDQIREYHVMDLGNATRTIAIPIKEEAIPNLYVSVLAVKGGGEGGIPEFRLGYADVQVNTSNKVLHLTLTPDKKVYKPGERVTVMVEAKKADGSPAEAEISLAVVDERVVALLGSIDKNILGRFWFIRSIGVTTAQTLTRLVKKVFFSTEGGGGGKGDDGSSPVRGNLLDTAFWKADVVTDKTGQARVSFVLPDNLTSWQILAIGTTKDTIVGSAEASIITRRDLMVEPVIPRILRKQDTVRLGATVHNETSAWMGVDVSIEASGVSIEGNTIKHITIAAKSRTIVSWTAHVPVNGDAAKITFHAKGGGLEDGIESSVPIYSYGVPEVVSTSNFLDRTATEEIEIPGDVAKDRGELKISVAPTVGNGLQGGVEYLLDYSYGCSEQTTSAVLASLVYQQLAQEKFIKQDKTQEEAAKTKAEGGIKLLTAMQRADGGWGFWSESDTSYPHLTAYVFWGLFQAKKAGFNVDEGVLDRADQYLRNSLADITQQTPNPWGLGMTSNEKAQVLFMLAERNPGGLSGYASSLYERRAGLGQFAKAFLAMALADIYQGSPAKSAIILTEIKNDLVYLDATTAYAHETEDYGYLMNSDIRSTAVYLQALLRLNPQSADVERLARYLMTHRTSGYWESTQDTAMALLSLVQYAKLHPIDTQAVSVDVFVDQIARGALAFPQGDVSGQASVRFPLADLMAKGDTHQIGLEKPSDKRYSYDVNLTYERNIADIAPVDNGLTVLSDYYALDDAKHEHPLLSFTQGDTVRVRMKLLVPKHRDYVSFEHYLPSGLEAIDLTLKTSPQALGDKTQACAPDWNGGTHCMDMGSMEYAWWWENAWKHIEFRDDRVFLFAERLEPGVYEYEFLAQAVTAGEFRVPPARAYEFYHPGINAHNEGKMIKIMGR